MKNVITDAELVTQYAKKAMEEPEKVITSRAPSDGEVRLPGGVIAPTGEVIRTAEVRELTGADEEAIAKSGSRAKSLQVLLQRGLVKIGSKEATKDDLDVLLSGDRDAILIGIRCVTFGDELPAAVKCPNCTEVQDVIISLSKDVPVKELENPIEDRTWMVTTSKGAVAVTLPNGNTQRKLLDNSDKTSSELNTLLLSGCVLSINGSPSMGAPTALSLGMADRTTIINEILSKNPGPRLGEVKKACKACGEDISIPLSLFDLF